MTLKKMRINKYIFTNLLGGAFKINHNLDNELIVSEERS
ncbi:hypothetical protein MSUIS_07030 [Mycoplasma suis KI3806]|uniref:Uncharacterized protein n=1 Tax=Mycoplasma suis (strain KI_3806) TaxID=708248 RepID=F0V2B5_MYCS3|nr:hypothetical protein MSUIS_07030 [Mycoplasma suis KI3806]